MTDLNLAEICANSRTLGPGNRFIIWVQGCCFRCRDCISPEWIPQKTATLVSPQRLGDLILSTADIEGITISGGEPMLQAAALSELLAYLHSERDLSAICYSGFTLSQLRQKSDRDIEALLAKLDVLIDGQYIPELNDNRGWRGSQNQTVHFLTSRYCHEAERFTQRRRDVEIHIRDEEALMVGVPPHNFRETFHQAIDISIN